MSHVYKQCLCIAAVKCVDGGAWRIEGEDILCITSSVNILQLVWGEDSLLESVVPYPPALNFLLLGEACIWVMKMRLLCGR